MLFLSSIIVTNWNVIRQVLSLVVLVGLNSCAKSERHPLSSQSQKSTSAQSNASNDIPSQDPDIFLRTQVWKQTASFKANFLPTNGIDQLEIFYGEGDFGYFRATKWSATDSTDAQLTVEVIPPTYSTNLHFYAYNHNSKSCFSLGDFRPRTPIPNIYRGLYGKVTGEFDFPFVILPGSITNKVGAEVHFVYILNKRGEVVWLHFPDAGMRSFNYHLVAKRISAGRYGVLSYRSQSYFEIADYSGNIISRVDPRLATQPYAIHHDFLVEGDNRTMLTLGHQTRHVRKFPRVWPQNFPDLWEKLKIVFDVPISIVVQTLLKVDLDKNEATVLWDPSNDLSPHLNPGFFIPDPLLRDFSKLQEYRESLTNSHTWANWGEDANVDWLHLNSLNRTDDGKLLISSRNLSEVFVLDSAGRQLLERLTCAEHRIDGATNLRDTLGDQCFLGQHHVGLTANKQMILFDNHASFIGPNSHNLQSDQRPRVSVLDWDQQKSAWLHHVSYFSPDSNFTSRSRGSVYQWGQKSLVALFPRDQAMFDSIYQWNIGVSTPTGSMEVPRLTHAQTYRAEPIDSLSEDPYSKTLPEACQALTIK
jgi:hypothetical protein